MPAVIEHRTKVAELKEERAKLVQSMRAVLDTADAESRSLTAEESQECDRVEERIGEVDTEIRRRETVLSIDDVQKHRLAGAAEEAEERNARKIGLTLNEWRAANAPARPQDDEEYREAFYRLVSVRDVRELEINELRALSKATAGAGANLVPTTFARTLIDALRWVGSMRSLATVITTDAGEAIQVPTVSSHGTAAWVAENAAYTESDEAFGLVTLNAYKAGTIIKVSEELLADSAFDLEAYLRNEFGLRIGVLEETAYVVGDGSGKPTGVTTQATAGVTAAAVATVTGDELIDLSYSLAKPYRARAQYLVSDAMEKIARKLKGSDGQYLWQPGLQVGAPNVFNGYPVVTHPDIATPATGVISALFGDFSYYWIRDVNGVAFQRLEELYAANGQVGFRAFHRTDGKLLNTAAVKKLTQA